MMYDVVYKFIESEVSVLEELKCSAAIKRTIADHVLGKHLEVLDEEADLFDLGDGKTDEPDYVRGWKRGF